MKSQLLGMGLLRDLVFLKTKKWANLVVEENTEVENINIRQNRNRVANPTDKRRT